MGEDPSFEVSLARILADHQKVEIIGVFRNLLGEVGLRRRQGAIKIGLSPPLTAIQATLDLVHQDIAAPPMLDCRSQVPLPFRRIFDLVEQHAIVEPRNLCSSLLHKLLRGPDLGKGTHVLQVAGRESLRSRECAFQIARQTINDLRSPLLLCLALENLSANLPVQQDQLPVHRQASPQLCLSNPVFQGFEELGVIRWKVSKFTHKIKRSELNQSNTSRGLHEVIATSKASSITCQPLPPNKFTRRALCSVLVIRSPPSRLTAGWFDSDLFRTARETSSWCHPTGVSPAPENRLAWRPASETVTGSPLWPVVPQQCKQRRETPPNPPASDSRQSLRAEFPRPNHSE